LDSSRPNRFNNPLPTEDPMEIFSAPRITRKEHVVKQEIDRYHVSEVDETEVIYVGKRSLSIYQSLDLPDALCEGYTFKQRLIATEGGECLLIARWKPDRHMRRSASAWSQKWFVEKELFPPNQDRLFTRFEKRIEEASEAGEAS
jgi:hypothetical protein